VAAQKGILFEAVTQAREQKMPLPAYVHTHAGTAVTPERLEVLKRWLDPFAAPPAPVAAPLPVTEVQDAHVKPAPNGIEYPLEALRWRPISLTDRRDNGTLRVIAGNPIALEAIAQGHTNPWPDGAALAKIAYQAVPDASGHLTSGAFKQVEVMEKDATKFKDSLGWGFARWRGTALTPYGENAGFVQECVGCHVPMQAHDFAYTIPVPEMAALGPALVQGSSVDFIRGTTSVKYRKDSGALEQLTWKQREDPHWFGARIPGALVTP
jgi:hypothetical protein